MIIDKPQAADIPALRRLWKQAFGDTDGFLDGFFRAGFAIERCRFASLDGQLAAALYWFDCHWEGKKLAYLYAVATDESYRGKGLCRGLMEDTHRHLKGLGYAGAVLVPGSDGLFALYEKMGYRPFCPMETVTVKAGDTPVCIRPVSADAFEQLRRSRVPAGSVLQEDETVAFAATFCDFCTGEDTLMCFSHEGGTLYVQEYLGDAALLGGIIKALHAEKAVVRLPGGSTPTAMYHALDGTDELPTYFGIALN